MKTTGRLARSLSLYIFSVFSEPDARARAGPVPQLAALTAPQRVAQPAPAGPAVPGRQSAG